MSCTSSLRPVIPSGVTDPLRLCLRPGFKKDFNLIRRGGREGDPTDARLLVEPVNECDLLRIRTIVSPSIRTVAQMAVIERVHLAGLVTGPLLANERDRVSQRRRNPAHGVSVPHQGSAVPSERTKSSTPHQ